MESTMLSRRFFLGAMPAMASLVGVRNAPAEPTLSPGHVSIESGYFEYGGEVFPTVAAQIFLDGRQIGWLVEADAEQGWVRQMMPREPRQRPNIDIAAVFTKGGTVVPTHVLRGDVTISVVRGPLRQGWTGETIQAPVRGVRVDRRSWTQATDKVAMATSRGDWQIPYDHGDRTNRNLDRLYRIRSRTLDLHPLDGFWVPEWWSRWAELDVAST